MTEERLPKNIMLRYTGETLTDNSRLKKYEQCKDCLHVDSEDVWHNSYDKGHCAMYPYPDEIKPNFVFDGSKDCEFYEKKEE